MYRYPSHIAVILCALAMASAQAATTVHLPTWTCSSPDTLFRSGYEAGEIVPHDASNGSGGVYPGNTTRSLSIAGLGSGMQTYYLHVPPDYTPGRAWPLIIVLHGTAPNSATPPNADSYAQATRDSWVTTADAGHFLVAAPVANDAVGAAVSWLVPPRSGPTDYNLFAAIRADMQTAYNIERTRLYGWGFSSGGSVMHDLAINNYGIPGGLDANSMAAYAVNAGPLAALACYGVSDATCNQELMAMPRRPPFDLHVGHVDTDGNNTLNAMRADKTRFIAHGWVLNTDFYYTEFSDGSPPGGHTYTTAQLSQIWTNLCRWAVVP